MYRASALAFVALLAAVVPASAQDEKKFDVNIGAGFTIPYSDAKEHFGTGGNFQLGGILNISPVIGVQAEYVYNRFGSKDIGSSSSSNFVTSIPLTANHTMHEGDFNLILNKPMKDAKAAPYALVGMGVYHDIVNVTTPSVGVATVCDPWLLICYPTAVPVENIVGERSNTAFGLDFGGGVNIRVGASAKFYAEIRYIHTYGPSFTTPAGQVVKANGNYWPFTFGFKF
jgi:opacity protein-like surface antigen